MADVIINSSDIPALSGSLNFSYNITVGDATQTPPPTVTVNFSKILSDLGNVANGFAKLDENTKLLSSVLPTLTTDDIQESGTPTNLWFTDARADARITAQKNAANGIVGLDANKNATIDGSVTCGKITSTTTDIANPIAFIQNNAQTANSACYFKAEDNAGNSILFGADGFGFTGVGNVGDFTLGTWSDKNIRFYTNATQKAMFTNTGNFGIGITPTEKLHVSGNSIVTGTISAGAVNTGVITCGAVTADGALTFKPDTSDRDPASIGNGRVFFRVDEPNDKVYIKGKTSAGVVYNYDLTASGTGSGDVSGPASSMVGAVATYSDTSGKNIDFRTNFNVFNDTTTATKRISVNAGSSSGLSIDAIDFTGGTDAGSSLRLNSAYGGEVTVGKLISVGDQHISLNTAYTNYNIINSYKYDTGDYVKANLSLAANQGEVYIGALDADGLKRLKVKTDLGADFALYLQAESYNSGSQIYTGTRLALNPNGGSVLIGTNSSTAGDNTGSQNYGFRFVGSAPRINYHNTLTTSNVVEEFSDANFNDGGSRTNAKFQRGILLGSTSAGSGFFFGRRNVSSNDFFLNGDGDLQLGNLGTGSGAALQIDASGNVVESTSSLRYKDVLKNEKYDPSFILDIVDRIYDRKDNNLREIGIIAEELEKLEKKHGDLSLFYTKKPYKRFEDSAYKPKGNYKDSDLIIDGVKYDRLIMPIIKIIQKHQKDIESLKKRKV